MRELADIAMLVFLGYCAWTDWKTRELPLYVLLLFSVAAAILTIFSSVSLSSFMGGILLGVFFLIVSKLSKEAIGYGDSWIILLLGMYLGGIRLLRVLCWASFCAAICSLVYIWRHKGKREGTLPFVPFMTLGYIGVVFL